MAATIPWVMRQYIAVILALLGLVSTGFSGVVAWSYRELSTEVKLLTNQAPVFKERLEILAKTRENIEAAILLIKENQAIRATNMAVMGEQMKHVSLRLDEISHQIRKLTSSQPPIVMPYKEVR